ncbi:MAG TPA: Wzz/FepE/Etk N-terminal domain-containing protein [Bacteroidia bacterium]|nr:Wzz/FepE/Etk N-terminal domain-containing protein [Bacteroidia bacterium]
MSNENRPEVFDSGNLLVLIFSKWKPLLIITLVAMIISLGISFILPEKFKATVVLFPSQGNNLSRAFLSEQADETKDFLAFGEDNNAEQMLQVLKSDELMYALEKKFNLLKYYSLSDKWDKYYLFKGYYNDLFVYDITQYESIEIIVYDQSPAKASEMANEAAHLADSLFQGIIKQRSQKAFKVVKAQYDSSLAVANKLEDSMNYYRNLGILNWEYQVKELTSGYADAEVKGNAEAVKNISDKLKVFSQNGKGYWVIANELENNFKWMKQVKTSYEEAKVNAEQTIPSFFVADKAIPADRKTYPIRGLVVAGGTLAALLISILALLIANRLKTLKKK